MVKIDEAYKTLHLFILLTFIPKLKYGKKNYRLPRLKYKRKIINVPNDKVRPTSAIKREAIFSILQSYANNNSFDLYTNRCVIDLFAGSGSLGLEAISRGASFAFFYELDNNVIKILEENCQKI